MALIWLEDHKNNRKYYPIVDEDETGFWIKLSLNKYHWLQKNTHHLSRIIGVVNDT